MQSNEAIHSPFQDRVVAFIDILGFRDLLKRMTATDPGLFSLIKNALESMLRDEQRAYEPLRQSMMASHSLETTSFSDCTVISEGAIHDPW